MSIRLRFDARRPRRPECFFAVHAYMDGPGLKPVCDGRLVRCHLLPQQLLRNTAEYKELETEGARYQFLYDPRSWVWGCGGPMGASGHHGMFDVSKRLRVARCDVPAATEELALELGLIWYLDKTYGQRRRLRVIHG